MCHFPFVRYSYTGKAGTKGKRFFSNGGNFVRYGYACKAGIVVKGLFSNAGNAVGHGYADKGFTGLKSHRPDAGKGAAGKVEADIFLRVVFQRFPCASGSEEITAKAAHVQSNVIGCGFCVGCLSVQPGFKGGNRGKGLACGG